MSDAHTIDRLFAVIQSRSGGDPAKSYTAQLLGGGPAAIARKLGEEAMETVIASLSGDKAAVVAESADLLYHLLVLWAAAGVSPNEVYTVLNARSGRSGLAEKASRNG